MLAKRSSQVGDSSSWATGLAWLALLGTAVAIRVIAWSQTVVLFNDGPIFLALAEAVSAGHWREVLSHPYHPLFPVAIAGIAQAGLSLESAAIAVSILGGLLGIVSLFQILHGLFDREVAWLGAIALALHPWAVDFSSDVMSDGLYLGLYLAGFAALQSRAERSRSICHRCLRRRDRARIRRATGGAWSISRSLCAFLCEVDRS